MSIADGTREKIKLRADQIETLLLSVIAGIVFGLGIGVSSGYATFEFLKEQTLVSVTEAESNIKRASEELEAKQASYEKDIAAAMSQSRLDNLYADSDALGKITIDRQTLVDLMGYEDAKRIMTHWIAFDINRNEQYFPYSSFGEDYQKELAMGSSPYRLTQLVRASKLIESIVDNSNILIRRDKR